MTGIFKRVACWLIKAECEGRRNHEAVLRLLRKVQCSSLLDVGCAEGEKTEDYALALGISLGRVKGIEAQEKYAVQAGKKFEVYRVDMEKDLFPVPDEAFDLVVCNQVLEHLKNIFRPLSEMDRIVKTDGFLLIGVPNLASLYNRFLLVLGRQPLAIDIDGPHVRGFAYSAFLRFLRQNPNFEVIAVDSSNLYPLPYPLLEVLGGRLPAFSSAVYWLLKKKVHDPAACGWRTGPAADTVFD